MSPNDCAGGPNDLLTKNLVDDLLREPKCAYVKFVHDVPYHQACMVDGLVERVQQLTTELADTQRSLEVAHEAGDYIRGRLSDVLSERDRLFNELHEVKSGLKQWPRDVAKIEELTKEADRLRRMLDGRDKRIDELCGTGSLAQANYECVAKERDQLRKELVRLKEVVRHQTEVLNNAKRGTDIMLETLGAERDKAQAETRALKEELDLLNRNHAKLLAVRDEQLARSVAALESVRVSRFWKLVTELGLTPKHAKSVIYEAEEIVKDLGKPA